MDIRCWGVCRGCAIYINTEIRWEWIGFAIYIRWQWIHTPPPPTLRHMHTTHRNMHACTHHKHMHVHIVYSGEIKYLVRNCVDLHWQRHVCVVYSEEIAFYQGQRREQHIIIATFNKLVSGLSVSTSFSQGSFLELHTPVRCLHCGLGIVLFSLWDGDCADVFTVGWGLC